MLYPYFVVALFLALMPAFCIAQPVALVKDINTGPGTIGPGGSLVGTSEWSDRAVVGNHAYFAAFEFGAGTNLWRSDGTSAGTTLLTHAASGQSPANPSHFTVAGGVLFFAADGPGGRELWKIDNTGNPVPVKDIRPGNTGSNPYWLAAVGSLLLFVADDGTHGNELWKSDGTEAGTTLVADLTAGSTSTNFNATVTTPAVANGEVYFSANTGQSNGELWKSDGTTAGTVLVRGFATDAPTSLAACNGLLFFAINGDSTAGSELWKSDGTLAGTVMVKDINPGAAGSGPVHLAAVGSVLYFNAGDANGRELWKSDGTQAGTVMVADINPSGDSGPDKLAAFGSMLLFSADDGTHGIEPWVSDGTQAGTQRLADIQAGAGDSVPAHFAAFQGFAYFQAFDATNGAELWRTDGTPAGTTLVADINAGVDGSSPSGFVAVAGGNCLLFGAYENTTGFEPWVLTIAAPPASGGPVAGASDSKADAGGGCAAVAGSWLGALPLILLLGAARRRRREK